MKRYRNPAEYRSRVRRVLSINTEAAVGVKSVAYVARVSSNSQPFHTVRIHFYNVEFVKEVPDGKENDYIPIGVKGALWYYKIPSMRSNPVRLFSTSDSYRFEYMKQNYDIRVNVGNWKRYKRITPPSKRPARPKNPNPVGKDFVNPKNIPGYDITIYSLIRFLLRNKLLKER